tara:strand:- start:199 stop:480 length:282 start_codon:yes stop_codon:yes gene_type:complete
MFDNLSTALVQAIGFLGVFGFFVYQLLSEDNNKNNSQLNTSNKNLYDKPTKKGLFGRKIEAIKQEENPKKKRLLNRKIEEEVEEKPKRKGWFN